MYCVLYGGAYETVGNTVIMDANQKVMNTEEKTIGWKIKYKKERERK